MSNKDLLKQAIAEAKTIREAAIANAKEALEETLTPHLKEMLAQKLQEMEEDEDKMEETINNAENQDYSENPRAHGNLEEAEEAEEEEAEEEEAPEGEEEGEEEEEIEIEDMSIDDLKDLIRDIVSQEVGHDESEEELPGEEAPEGEEDMVSMDGDSEEIDINELLAELDEMDSKEEVKEGQEIEEVAEYLAGAKDLVEMFPFLNMTTASLVIGALGAAGLTAFSAVTAKVMDMALAGRFGDKAKSFAQNLEKAGGAAAKARNVSEEEVEEGLGSAIKGAAQRVSKGLEKAYDAVANAPELGVAKSFEKNVIDKGAAGLKKAGFLGTNMTKGQRAFEGKDEELNEALEAVKVLRNQLQEVNLLNAKLLYVNKVFKTNNLSEGQKVNVIAAFDKAETVKEVKLVFETVSKNVVAKPTAIKEHRSFASKATGNAQTTAPKEILSEVSEQVSRWQKLAGIIK